MDFVIPIDASAAAVQLYLTEQAVHFFESTESWQCFNVFLNIVDHLVTIVQGVKHDIPPRVVAAGNSCHVIRPITDADKVGFVK